MGLGFGKVLGKSVLKALKNTGITVGTIGVVAVGTALQNPELLAPIWASTGPVAPIALFVLSIGGQAIVDAVKHRDKI
jgi:hypothetical protein